MKNSAIKLNQLAKDLGLANNDLFECLALLGGEPKKAMSALTPEEVSFVFDYFTQKNAVKDLNAYFANNVAPEKPKKETKKAAAK
ncbi:MAG: translation initiation factor IF-2 N-terminal domain-containing protein, partial [Ruminococcus sp.]|nr:translation initiation factor IF-2 N-terminal domain-containing protein [Ruminococcus sp.]